MKAPFLFTPQRFGDSRGWLAETYNVRTLAALGLDVVFVQDNQSMSSTVGTVRGLHFQAPPHAQGKLVRALKGKILDIAVDIRNGSPTYGQWVTAEISADNNRQIYVPVGYAHGFVTMEPNTEVLYKVTAHYHKESEGGFLWNDPTLAIDWKLGTTQPLLSAKDEILPSFANFKSPFTYDGVPMQPLQP